MATYTGTSGNDNLAGTSAADLILGDAGNDNIIGNGGRDSLYGGAGNDNITFGPTTGPGSPTLDTSSSIIYGGLGSDTIQGNGQTDYGFNTVYGGTGTSADSADGANTINLVNDSNADLVFAGGGGDSITVGFGAGSSVTGGAGNDVILATAGASRFAVNANQGNDSVTGSTGGGDLLHGGQGNDTITLNSTSTTYAGSVVAADLGNDLILDSTGGNNSLYGGQGNDSITHSGSGNDVIFGGFGADSIAVSGSGSDTIYGGTGNATLDATDLGNLINASKTGVGTTLGAAGLGSAAIAGNGLVSATGADLLVGGGGNDTIVASSSTNTNTATPAQPTAIDTLTGGGGNDLFGFGGTNASPHGYANGAATTASTVDAVTDFVSGVDQFKFGDNNRAAGYSVGNNAIAQTNVDNSGATTLAAAANAAIVGTSNATQLAGNSAVIFNYQGSNFLVVNTSTTAGTAFSNADYLLNVGTLTNVTRHDLNG